MNTQAILTWAIARGLIYSENPQDPFRAWDKILEELVEARDDMHALAFGKPMPNNLQAEIGDVLFATCVLAYRLGWDPNDCLGMAIIKNASRRGTLVNGQFVKEKDLHTLE